MLTSKYARALSVSMLLSLLSACSGGGGSDGSAPSSSQTSNNPPPTQSDTKGKTPEPDDSAESPVMPEVPTAPVVTPTPVQRTLEGSISYFSGVPPVHKVWLDITPNLIQDVYEPFALSDETGKFSIELGDQALKGDVDTSRLVAMPDSASEISEKVTPDHSTLRQVASIGTRRSASTDDTHTLLIAAPGELNLSPLSTLIAAYQASLAATGYSDNPTIEETKASLAEKLGVSESFFDSTSDADVRQSYFAAVILQAMRTNWPDAGSLAADTDQDSEGASVILMLDSLIENANKLLMISDAIQEASSSNSPPSTPAGFADWQDQLDLAVLYDDPMRLTSTAWYISPISIDLIAGKPTYLSAITNAQYEAQNYDSQLRKVAETQRFYYSNGEPSAYFQKGLVLASVQPDEYLHWTIVNDFWPLEKQLPETPENWELAVHFSPDFTVTTFETTLSEYSLYNGRGLWSTRWDFTDAIVDNPEGGYSMTMWQYAPDNQVSLLRDVYTFDQAGRRIKAEWFVHSKDQDDYTADYTYDTDGKMTQALIMSHEKCDSAFKWGDYGNPENYKIQSGLVISGCYSTVDHPQKYRADSIEAKWTYTYDIPGFVEKCNLPDDSGSTYCWRYPTATDAGAGQRVTTFWRKQSGRSMMLAIRVDTYKPLTEALSVRMAMPSL